MNNEYDNKNSENSGTAYLTVRASSADNAIPLSGVKIIIRDGDSDKGILYSLYTNSSGKTETVSVSVPPKELSVFPNNERKYGTVNIEASLSGYHTMSYSSVPLFDTIYATQNVKMIPISENGQNFISDYREGMSFEIRENSL